VRVLINLSTILSQRTLISVRAGKILSWGEMEEVKIGKHCRKYLYVATLPALHIKRYGKFWEILKISCVPSSWKEISLAEVKDRKA